MNSPRPQGWVRLGINAEKSTLESCRSLYDGLAIPAHVLALYRNSLGQSLFQWNKPYFVDPMTYVFLRDRAMISRLGTKKPRKSYEKLCEYSQQAKYYLDANNLDVEGMSHTEMINFADTMAHLTFQIQSIGMSQSKPPRRVKSLQRIQKYVSSDSKQPKVSAPSFLVSPYFFIESVGDATYRMWIHSVNLFQKKAKTNEINLPIYWGLCLNETILEDDPSISRIIKDVSNADGVVLWIDNFEKGKPNIDRLEGFGGLIKGFKQGGLNVISLYGGYLTAVYYHFGLDGLSFGLNAGDSKIVDSYPTGGGAPARYYEPNLHTFQTAKSMYTYFGNSLERAQLFKCNCPKCIEVTRELKDELEASKIPKHLTKLFNPKRGGKISADWTDMREHFLHVRSKELFNIGSHTLTKLGEEARHTLLIYGKEKELNLDTLNLVDELSSIAP